MEEHLELYDRAMRNLDLLAAVDLRDWWEAGNRHERDPEGLIDYLTEPFSVITERYGERAAYLTVDAMIINRNLDEELRWLPQPTPAEAAAFEQAHASLGWAVRTSKQQGEFDSPKAYKKLRGVINRLVYQPARRTVENTVSRDNTVYARIPSPGACSFCLMLAARGPAYSRDNVVATKQMGQYHDNCRCLGWEARGRTLEERWASLPPINRQLDDLWNKNIPGGSSGDASKEQRRQWRELIIFKRREATGSDEPVRFPPIKGLKLPKRSLKANHTAFGDVEPLPLVTNDAAGHILFGWDRRPLKPLDASNLDVKRRGHQVGDRTGHLWGSEKDGKTVFPKTWTQQDVINAVHASIEDPDQYHKRSEENRAVRKEINGVIIQVTWKLDGERAELKTAFPVRGKGVLEVADNNLVNPTDPHRQDEYFVDVRK